VRRHHIAIVLWGTALLAWWWSWRAAAQMPAGHGAQSLPAWVVMWTVMMAAMMLPAVEPVVSLYGRAAAAGHAAPLPVFVSGYLVVWAAASLPGWLAARLLAAPLAEGAAWTGRAAGVVLLLAAVYQLTPLKEVCLRHCRSPLGFFLQHGGDLRRPSGAARAGAAHGLYCLGCCWALMLVLVAFGGMHLGWMLGLAALVFAEKNFPRGDGVARAAAVGLGLLGAALLVDPRVFAWLT
jgi:predicted metal-binding membrane protein